MLRLGEGWYGPLYRPLRLRGSDRSLRYPAAREHRAEDAGVSQRLITAALAVRGVPGGALDDSVAAIGVAAASLEGEPVMLAERADGVGVLDIRVGVRHADDDRPEGAI